MNPNLHNLESNEEKIREALNAFCYIKSNNEIIINYETFKILNKIIDKKIILNYLLYTIETVLKKFELFIVHANIKKLTLLEIDKNKDFIYEMSNILKEKFNDKLDSCYIYDSSFIFKQIHQLLAMFVDKKTITKIIFSK
jgi:hypothetical protein